MLRNPRAMPNAGSPGRIDKEPHPQAAKATCAGAPAHGRRGNFGFSRSASAPSAGMELANLGQNKLTIRLGFFLFPFPNP